MDKKYSFKTQVAAAAFLREMGYKISQSKFCNDVNAGLISRTDKRFLSSDLLAYADRELSAPDPAKIASGLRDVRAKDVEVSAELRGICLGILADGKVVKSEASFLDSWLERHITPGVTDWAIQQLGKRVSEMLLDGDFSSTEAAELHQLLARLTLSEAPQTPEKDHEIKPQDKKGRFDPYHDNGALELIPPRSDIFDQVTEIDFGRTFCLTGIFVFGDRKSCANKTQAAGGTLSEHPTKNDCYLVVGSVASPQWKHGNYGDKICQAIRFRQNGGSIQIIPEDIWAEALIAAGV